LDEFVLNVGLFKLGHEKEQASQAVWWSFTLSALLVRPFPEFEGVGHAVFRDDDEF